MVGPDDRGVDEVEALEVLRALAALRERSYQELVERLLDREETLEVVGPSGTRYQVELQGLWDARSDDILRVLGCVDDGGGGLSFRSRLPSLSPPTNRSSANSSTTSRLWTLPGPVRPLHGAAPGGLARGYLRTVYLTGSLRAYT